MKLNDLKEQRALKLAEARALVDKADAEKRAMTGDEQKAFDGLKAEIQKIEADEARAAFLADAERRAIGAPVDKAAAELEKRISVIDAINAQVEGRAIAGALAEYNQEQRHQRAAPRGVLVPASLFAEQRAAQTTTTAATITPDDYRPDQFVGILRNALVVRSLGARVLSDLRGDVVIPRQKTSHTAEWLAEGDALTDSGMTFDSIKLQPRHVGAITELSRQLLQQANPAIESLVRNDFVAVVSAAVDKALISGDGVKEPKGLLTAATGTGTLATPSWAAVLELIEGLALKNINPNHWLTSPEVATVLRSTLKASSAGSEHLLQDGQLAGLPVAVTNQVGKNGTTGQIILGDFSEMIVGQWGGIDVLANQYAEGPYSRGAVQVRILTTLDMIPRRPEAFTIVNDVTL